MIVATISSPKEFENLLTNEEGTVGFGVLYDPDTKTRVDFFRNEESTVEVVFRSQGERAAEFTKRKDDPSFFQTWVTTEYFDVDIFRAKMEEFYGYVPSLRDFVSHGFDRNRILDPSIHPTQAAIAAACFGWELSLGKD